MTAFTIDDDQTCYKCKHSSICYAKRSIDSVLIQWPINSTMMGDISTWQFLYNVLAFVCLKFEKEKDKQ